MIKDKSEAKFGVYLPLDLASQLESFMRETGIKSKSRLVQEALRVFLLEHAWKSGRAVAGIIGVFYNHEVRGVDEALTDLQHDYLDIILSTLHVHLTRDHCMLAITVRGQTERIRELVNKLISINGVIVVRPLLLAIGEENRDHADNEVHAH